MALVVFLRGVNVGGHRTFRPSVLVKELARYDVVNVGAAGTFVVRKPGSRARFRAALLQRLPFETTAVVCDARELVDLETEHPFGALRHRPDIVPFVSILAKPVRGSGPVPLTLPPEGEWLVRVIGSKGRFVFGMYRRRMNTVRYLGQLDRVFGATATTRNWNTIRSVLRILNGDAAERRTGRA